MRDDSAARQAHQRRSRGGPEQVAPGITRATFIFNLPRREYEKQFGTDYVKPKGWARIVGFLYHLIPKLGPFRALAFQAPTPEAEQLFLESFVRTANDPRLTVNQN